MLDYNTATQFNLNNLVDPSQAALTPTTVVMESLLDEWKRNPTPALTNTINEFVRMHYDWMSAVTDPTGKTFNTLWNQIDPTSVGPDGNPVWVNVFIDGRALDVLSEWYLLNGNPLALQIANNLDEYIRNYNNSQFWQTTNATLFPPQPGQFVGQTHTWMIATRGMLDHALALQKTILIQHLL